MSHSPDTMQEMGRLVADASEMGEEAFQRYESLLREAMKEMPTAGKHANVMTHMLGYFKEELASAEKQELLETVEQYREELVPLIVPLTLLKHYVRKYEKDYLARQTYLEPHPLELKLRNHA